MIRVQIALIRLRDSLAVTRERLRDGVALYRGKLVSGGLISLLIVGLLAVGLLAPGLGPDPQRGDDTAAAPPATAPTPSVGADEPGEVPPDSSNPTPEDPAPTIPPADPDIPADPTATSLPPSPPSSTDRPPPADPDYAFVAEVDGEPARLDPCANQIEVIYNPTGALYDAALDIAAAAQELQSGLGVMVEYAGTTSETSEEYWASPPSSPTILITWGVDLDRQAAGVTVSQRLGGEIVGSTITLDAADVDIVPGMAADPFAPTWGRVILHEFGHAVGLDHVSNADEVMFADAQPDRAATWGSGDLAGLQELARGTCQSDQRHAGSRASLMVTPIAESIIT